MSCIEVHIRDSVQSHLDVAVTRKGDGLFGTKDVIIGVCDITSHIRVNAGLVCSVANSTTNIRLLDSIGRLLFDSEGRALFIEI